MALFYNINADIMYTNISIKGQLLMGHILEICWVEEIIYEETHAVQSYSDAMLRTEKLTEPENSFQAPQAWGLGKSGKEWIGKD